MRSASELLAATVLALADLRRFLVVMGPMGGSDLLRPVASIFAVVGVALLAGVAVGAMTTLLVAVAALAYVASEVFGITIDLPVAE